MSSHLQLRSICRYAFVVNISALIYNSIIFWNHTNGGVLTLLENPEIILKIEE